MEAKHDGEGAGRQQLLVVVVIVVVIQAVSRCQGKSVSNLGREKKINIINIKVFRDWKNQMQMICDVFTSAAPHLLLMYPSEVMSSSHRSAAIQG